MFSEFIDVLSSDNSRLFKEQKIFEFGKLEPKFIQLLKRTYSPSYVYGIKKFDKPETFGNLTLANKWESCDFLLTKLSKRMVTGNQAKQEVELFASCLTEKEFVVFQNLLKGDLRCGINVSSINKAFPGTIPEYPYMRCSLPSGSNMKKWNWEEGIYSQQKADGMFANILYDKGRVTITSRNGTEFHLAEFKDFVDDFTKIAPEGVYNGELLVIESNSILPREIGNGVLNSVLKGGSFKDNQIPFYFVWDCVVNNIPYKDRFNSLRTLNGRFVDIIPTKIVYSQIEAYEHYKYMVECGFEGTVLKNPNALWKDGTSKDQVKFKVEAEVDLVCKGFNPGNGKNESLFGSMICESSCGRVQVNVSGFKDDLRKTIWESRDEWIGRIVTVRANSLMTSEPGKPNRLFLPRFVEERLDKTEADDYDKIVSIFDSAGMF